MFLRAGLGEVLEFGQVADGKEVGRKEEMSATVTTDADRQSNKGNNNGEEQE